jgi:cysteinyl-tRNA synthetase
MNKPLEIINRMRKVELSVIDDLNSAVASIKSLESDYDMVAKGATEFQKQARTLSGFYEQITTRATQTLKGYQNLLSEITKAQRQYVAQAKELGIDAKKTPDYNRSQQQALILESRIAFLKNELENELKSAIPNL